MHDAAKDFQAAFIIANSIRLELCRSCVFQALGANLT
jgi:hypothetical protein